MPQTRPNILLIMTDQQRLDTIAFLGGALLVLTDELGKPKA